MDGQSGFSYLMHHSIYHYTLETSLAINPVAPRAFRGCLQRSHRSGLGRTNRTKASPCANFALPEPPYTEPSHRHASASSLTAFWCSGLLDRKPRRDLSPMAGRSA